MDKSNLLRVLRLKINNLSKDGEKYNEPSEECTLLVEKMLTIEMVIRLFHNIDYSDEEREAMFLNDDMELIS